MPGNRVLFSSALGNVMVRPVPPNLVQPPTFLGMDPPQHTRYRQVMSAAFTPKPGREKLGFRRPA